MIFFPPLIKGGEGGIYISSLNPPKSPIFKGGLNLAKPGAPD